jgi:hypothetical protein
VSARTTPRRASGRWTRPSLEAIGSWTTLNSPRSCASRRSQAERPWTHAGAYSGAAYLAVSEDRTAEATSLLDTALRAAHKMDDPWTTMVIHGNLGFAHLFSADIGRARDAFARQLQLCADHAFRHSGPDEGFAGTAAVAAADGQLEEASRLRGAARGLGYPQASFDKRIDDRLEHQYLAAARARHGQAAWREGERAGATLSFEQAIAYALEQSSRPPTPPPDTQDPCAAIIGPAAW